MLEPSLVKSFNPGANPATILRGSGRWEVEGPTLLSALTPLVYGATIPVDISVSTNLLVEITDGVGFQFLNATGPAFPCLVLLRISNISGGAHGAGTFDTKWKVAGNVTAIADTNERTMLFQWNGVDTMVELFRGAADIPN